MKLLIVTQAVDLDDPVLGFFHRWIVEFSKRCETVHVICLKEGRHALPPNVFVHSLGKESGRSRMKYVSRFYRYIRAYRNEYDTVFVHMNQEYVLLGAPFWKLWRKKVAMWRNHYAGNWLTSVAVAWCDVVLCTSRNSYTAKFRKTRLMPIGIDTDFFSPVSGTTEPRSILFLGRLDASKNVDMFIRSLERLHEENVQFSATIIGDPSDASSKYAHDVRNLAAPLCLESVLRMSPAVTNDQARDLFRSYAIYCNLSPQGMFDKTIGEAMASGCIVVATNEALKSVLPQTLIPTDPSDAAAAAALRAALEMGDDERRALTQRSREFVELEHSLECLVQKLMPLLLS